MNDIFQPRAVSYTLRSQIDFTRPNVNSKHFGISSLRHMAAKIKMALKLSKIILENGSQLTAIASYVYNHFDNILRFFDVLPNFYFTTSETMCDYYLPIWYIRVTSRVAKRLKRILGNDEISEKCLNLIE